MIGDSFVPENSRDERGLAFGRLSEVKAHFRLLMSQVAGVRQRARVCVKLQGAILGVVNPDAGQRGVEVVRHGAGAAVQDGVQRITTGERKPDVFTERGEAGLFHGGLVRCLLAFESVTNRSLQHSRVETAFDQVVGGTGLHRLQIDLMLPLPCQQDDGRMAVVFDGGLEQFDSVVRSESVVDEADVVLVARHGVQSRREVLHPVELDLAASELGEQIARDDVVILVIFNEENAQRGVRMMSLH